MAKNKSFFAITGITLGILLGISPLIFTIFPELFQICKYCSRLTQFEFYAILISVSIITIISNIYVLRTKKDPTTILKFAILTLLIIFFLITIKKSFSQDEMEHIHVSWLISQGLTPYKDFIEFHTPLLLYAISIIIRLFGDTILSVYFLRALSFLVYTMLLTLTFLITQKLYNKRASYLAVLILMLNPVFFAAATEVLLDGTSILLILTSVYILLNNKSDKLTNISKSHILSGILLGLSFLTTQKVAPIIIFVLLWLAIERRYNALSAAIIGGASIALIALITILYAGIWKPFYQMTFLAPVLWQTNIPILDMIGGSLIEYSPFLILILLSIPLFRFNRNPITLLLLGQLAIFMSLIFSMSWLGKQDFIFLTILASIIIAPAANDWISKGFRLRTIFIMIYLLSSLIFLGRYSFLTNDVQVRTMQFVQDNTSPQDFIMDVKPTIATFRKDTSKIWYNRIEAIPALKKAGYQLDYNFTENVLTKKPRIIMKPGLTKEEIAQLDDCYDEITKNSDGEGIKALFLYNLSRC